MDTELTPAPADTPTDIAVSGRHAGEQPTGGPLGPLIDKSHPAAATWALFTGIGLLMIGNGLQGTLVGIRSEQAGFDTNVIGLVMSGYFVGILVGSRASTKALASVGHIRVFAGLASIASTSTLIYLITVNPITWGLMRFATGFCMAGLYVVAESWINELATNANRARLLAYYMVVSMAGFAAGQLLLNVADPSGIDLFLISSILISLALVPTSLSASSTPPPLTPATMSLRDLASIVPTGIVVSVLVGMASGALLGMGAVYATQAGMTAGQVSLFMGAPMVGGVLGQFPVGHLADRIPRRAMMIVLGLIASVAAAGLLVIEPASYAGYTMMFIIGACTFPLYSLAIAYTNDWLQPEQMLGASAALVTTNGVGAVVGPFLATFLMKAFGSTQYFVALLVTHAAVSVYVTYRVLTLSGARVPRPGDFGPFPARASAVTVYLLPRRKVGPPPTGITPDRQPEESGLESARKP